MSQSSMCPHFDEQTRKCSLLRKVQSQGSRLYPMYAMTGITPERADWRTEFCSTSKWAECSVNYNEQEGRHHPPH